MEKTFDRKKHWENIYQTKNNKDVSWYQATPRTSLNFLEKFKIPTTAKIIDIGGGDSFFVDNLLDMGYQHITVLDISKTAVEKAKKRLGNQASKVTWITTDVTTFKPKEKYDFWHDRAAFHFLTQEQDIEKYARILEQNIEANGVLVIGTFSEQGPEKCSGIKVKQYSETTLSDRLKKAFRKIQCISVDHHTPFGAVQNFIFCSFKKREN